MEPFFALLAICAGYSPVPVKSPHKGQWRRALVFSLICAWINDWVNNREAGDLGRHRGHYDVNVMTYGMMIWFLARCRIAISNEFENVTIYSNLNEASTQPLPIATIHTL